MKIIKQLFIEFIVPLLLSITWVGFNVYSGDFNSWNVAKIINIFGPTFFLLSWLTGQFFRVRKQSKVEDSFLSVESKLQEVVSNFERKTNELLDNITGGGIATQ